MLKNRCIMKSPFPLFLPQMNVATETSPTNGLLNQTGTTRSIWSPRQWRTRVRWVQDKLIVSLISLPRMDFLFDMKEEEEGTRGEAEMWRMELLWWQGHSEACVCVHKFVAKAGCQAKWGWQRCGSGTRSSSSKGPVWPTWCSMRWCY